MRLNQILIFLLCSITVFAKNNSVNKIELDTTLAYSNNYQFLVSGHFYGDSFNETHYPANTILGNVDLLNKMAFTISLGDLYMDVKNDYKTYQNRFYPLLKTPMYNAVGNHDVSGTFYEKNIAPTYFSFKTNGIFHIILNTELNDSKVVGQQLDSLKKWVSDFKNSSLKFLMIYSHRTIWAEEDSTLSKIFSDNTKSVFGSNFEDKIKPILLSIPKNKKIHWFSGSMGAQPYSFFYTQTDNIVYAATAIRASKKDAVLIVKYNQNNLSFVTKSLTNQELMPFSDYNIERYKVYKPTIKFNYRLIPLWVKNMLIHRYFWYGVFLILIVIFAVLRIVKK